MLTDYSPIYLVGPTGVGKSAVALELATRIDAEIVVADSMQVYRGLDIGTDKPSLREQNSVPHHLLDVVDSVDNFNVAKYVLLTRKKIQEIQDHHKTPLVVGGTGLYIRSLVDGIFEGAQKDSLVRERIQRRGETLGWNVLYERLKAVDPLAAQKIHPENHRRLVRALEVYEITGKPITEFQNQWAASTSRVCMIGLERDRRKLYQRINERVDRMFESGLAQEVQGLLPKGIEHNPVVMQAIGYKEVLSFLRGECTLEESKAQVKLHSRRFAKRQMTWFKKDSRVQWFCFYPEETTSEMAERILQYILSQGQSIDKSISS